MSDFLATTTTADLTNAIKTYYDSVLLETLDPNLYFYQFGEKRPVPKGEGKTVKWNLLTRFDLGRILTEGQAMTVSAMRNLSTVAVSGIVNQYGDAISVSDLADETVMFDVGRMAIENLAKQAAKTIDRVIANAIVNNVSTASLKGHFLFKTSTEVTDYWGMTSTISAGVQTVSSANLIAVSDIKDAVFKLRALNVQPYSGTDYIAIMPTEVAADIAGDSQFIGFHQYTNSTPLFNGEIGKLYGVRIVDCPTAPAIRGSNAGGTASTIAYGTTIFGKGFYGVTEWAGGLKTTMPEGASKSDPLNQFTIYGWKISFTSKVLNPSCGLVLFTGSNDTCTAATDAGGLRIEDPSTY
jgi:N4-gp56 family major capsid protein